MKIKKKENRSMEIQATLISDSEDKESTVSFVKEYYELGCRCFMCKRIVKKIEQNQVLSSGDHFHMRVCLPALKQLREQK